MLTPDIDAELHRISSLYEIDADTLQETQVVEMTDELLMDLIELLDTTVEPGTDPMNTDLYQELDYRTDPNPKEINQ